MDKVQDRNLKQLIEEFLSKAFNLRARFVKAEKVGRNTCVIETGHGYGLNEKRKTNSIFG